jgi:hypothetical protein
LADADAPQWLRVTAWLRQNERDHNELETTQLMKRYPAKMLAWLGKYLENAVDGKPLNNDLFVADAGLRPVTISLKNDLENLRKTLIKPADIGNALPPLRPAEIFRHLDAPQKLVDFGVGQRGEAGKVYVHQVLRAINWLVQSGKYREPWISQLRALTRHDDLKVRQAAFLAFASIGPELNPKNPLVDEFSGVIDDAGQPAAVRESAVMAFASFSHPHVFVRLHELALENKHPAWSAVMSKLLDRGNEFTLQYLKKIDKSKLADGQVKLFDAVSKQLLTWAQDPNRTRVVSTSIAGQHLERLAQAAIIKSPLHKELETWTRDFFLNQPDTAFDKHLQQIRAVYVPNFTVPDAAAFQAEVRRLAGEMLKGKGG